MKRKVLALLLCASMTCGLAACGGSGGTDDGKADGGSDEEVYNIHMQIPTWGTIPEGLEEVEQAINAIAEPEIGVTVTLNPIPVFNLVSESNLAISSGEQLDLMCILPYGGGMDSISNYTSKNMLLELDELYEEYGKDIQNCIGDNLIDIGYLDGKLYAISPNTLMGAGRGFIAISEVLDELGIEIDEDKVYTMDELEEMFEKYKEAYSDGYYAVAAFGSAGIFQGISPLEIDTLGGDIANGVLMDGGLSDNTTIENLVATEEYAEHVKRMRSWYEKGYFSPDVATISDGTAALLATGKYFGAFTTTQPNTVEVMGAGMSQDLTIIKTAEPYATTGVASLAMWAIPNTCDNPEKTMQFLNLMYQDREIENDIDSILAVGLEGSCYQVVEDLEGSRAIVDYVDGVDAANVPWQQACPIYGNQLTVPQFVPLTAEYFDEVDTYNQNIVDAGRKSNIFGYTFDPTSVSEQVAATQSIIAQYEPIIGTGSVDPDEVMPEYLKALEDAGINDVIAENQAQLDAWLEANK